MKRSVSCNIPLFLAFILNCSGQECHLVQPCGPGIVVDKSQIGGLLYVIPDGSQLTMDLCPRTDVSQWVVEVTTNGGQTLEGTYCINGVIFNSSAVCLYDNGLLAFIDLSSFWNEIGILELMFNSSSFNTTITIRYAKPGIVPAMSVIYFTEGEQVVLEYFMYTSDNVFDDSLIHNNEPLTDKDTILSPSVKQRFPDTVTCKDAVSSESTVVLKFLLQDTTIASAGIYQLVNGADSANITLIANFTATPTPSPSTNPTSSSTDLMTTNTTSTTDTSTVITYSTSGSVSSLSFTSSESPSMIADDSSDLVAIISGSVGAVVVVLIISIVIVIIVIAICRISTKTSVDETTDNNSEHRGNVRLHSFDKKPDEVLVPGPDTVEAQFTTSIPLDNNGISNGDTKHVHPESTVLDSSTSSSSSQDNEGVAITDDRKPHPSTDRKPHSSADGGHRKINKTSNTEPTTVNPNLQNTQSEILNVQKETLEVAKESQKLIKKLVDINVQSNLNRSAEHQENMESQKEIRETSRDIMGTLDQGLVRPENDDCHGDNTGSHHGDDISGHHGDDDNHGESINNSTIDSPTDTHHHLPNDLNNDSNKVKDSKDDTDSHHDN